MHIIALPHPDQLDCLRRIIDRYARSGMPSEELPLVADTFLCVANARELPEGDLHLGRVKVASVSPDGVAIETDPEIVP